MIWSCIGTRKAVLLCVMELLGNKVLLRCRLWSPICFSVNSCSSLSLWGNRRWIIMPQHARVIFPPLWDLKGPRMQVWVCGPSVFLATDRHGSPKFYSGLGISVQADAALSEAEASGRGGREQPYPRWCREEETYYANLSQGKLLVFLFMAECTAHKKCTTSKLELDFRNS